MHFAIPTPLGLLRRGVPAEVVQKLLGHASVTTTTETYQHLEVEDLRRVLRDKGCLDRAVGGQ
jgi:integrase/recombinase XerD